MKTMLTKVTYMVIGSLLTLIGYHFGNIDNNSVNAQLRDTPQETEIVDEIKCRKLVIVGKDDTSRITLVTNLSDRGVIQIYNENSFPKVSLGVANNLDTGFIRTEQLEINKLYDTTVRLGTDDLGSGTLILYNRSGIGKDQMSVTLGTDAHGGYLAIFNKVFDTAVVQASITDKGEGYIFTRDKTGHQTGRAGSPGSHIIREKIRN